MKNTIKLFCLLLVLSLCLGLSACGEKNDTTPTTDAAAETPAAGTDTSSAATPEETPTAVEAPVIDDKAAADEVAALIDAIYVQTRNENTDAQCLAAKTAWDALTDAQKELVEGEEADPDYFGRDTGDASLDDPRNADGIGKNEILVVSFGTSFNDSRAEDIKGIEDAVAAAFPQWSVRRAFTAQIIINHIQARDSEFIDNMDQAMERAVANGVENLIILPTHLMHGAEYDELMDVVEEYGDKIANISVAEPLLGPVGTTATEINADKKAVAEVLCDAAVKDADFITMKDAADNGVAFVFMGHGTSHNAKVSYTQMQAQMEELGYKNVFIGTVEGEPESTACESVIEACKAAGYTKVILRPLMVVAGDHANNDMAGEDEDSWKSMFEAAGCFESVDAQIVGLGRLSGVQDIYVSHVADVEGEFGVVSDKLPDGIYAAKFNTDSSMFHVNETKDDWGVLTVVNGEMTIHVSLASKGILNLYLGLANEAAANEADWLTPTVDSITYPDGLVEEVNGYDIPVPYLNEDFDCALIGKKGIWYDHKVSVTDVTEIKLEQFNCAATLSGGSGKAKVSSPCLIEKDADGNYWATVIWSSKNYEYMLIGETQYDPINTEGNSTFRIPVVLDEDMAVSALTVAMSEPHLVDYTLRFDGSTLAEGAPKAE